MIDFSKLVRPLLPHEYEDLKNDIKLHGIVNPIITAPDGRIVDGYHRSAIAKELDIYCPSIVEDRPDEELEALAKSLNYARRHLTREERDTLILQRNKEGKSTRVIAEEARVSQPTVINVLRRDKDLSRQKDQQNQRSQITGLDGKIYPASKTIEEKRLERHTRALKRTPPEVIALLLTCATAIKQCLEDNETIETVNINAMLRASTSLQKQLGILVRTLSPKKLTVVGDK